MKHSKHFYILIAISIFCVLGHLFSPPSWGFAHEFLFKFTYLPIVLAAIWYGRWFAFQLVTLFCLVYIFHIFIQLYHHTHHNLFSIFLDLGLYFLVAWVTGHLSEKEKSKSVSLEEAYKTLKEKTELLIEFEEKARRGERLKTMGELAGTVAHEVRTPLSALQGAVEIVVSNKSDNETKTKFSKLIFDEIQRIDQVIKNFLKLGQEKDPQIESIKLNNFMDDALTLLKPILKKNNIKIETKLEEVMIVLANEDQLKQVFINLIMNSVAAINDDNGKININVIDNLANVEIYIVDNGEGISEKLSTDLFKAFSTTKKDGSGLGLFLSRNIIRSFSGELSLHTSKYGHTEFLIVLPKGHS